MALDFGFPFLVLTVSVVGMVDGYGLLVLDEMVSLRLADVCSWGRSLAELNRE